MLPKEVMLDRLKEDIVNLEKVRVIFSDAIQYLEKHTATEFYVAFDDRLEEAEQLIGRTYFDT